MRRVSSTSCKIREKIWFQKKCKEHWYSYGFSVLYSSIFFMNIPKICSDELWGERYRFVSVAPLIRLSLYAISWLLKKTSRTRCLAACTTMNRQETWLFHPLKMFQRFWVSSTKHNDHASPLKLEQLGKFFSMFG